MAIGYIKSFLLGFFIKKAIQNLKLINKNLGVLYKTDLKDNLLYK